MGALLTAVSLAVAATSAGEPGSSPRIGARPPEVAWVTVAGDTLTWDRLGDGHPVVMVFWATWCKVCKKEWPKIQTLVGRFGDAPTPPVWASVSLGEEPERVSRVAKERGLPGWIIADPSEKNGKELGIEFVPVVCILDRGGRVTYWGAPKRQEMEKILSTLTSNTKEIVR